MAKVYPIAIGRLARGVDHRQWIRSQWSPCGRTDPAPRLAISRPTIRIVRRLDAETLLLLRQYPATGPGPGDDVVAQRLDCPFMGRCGGCWLEHFEQSITEG